MHQRQARPHRHRSTVATLASLALLVSLVFVVTPAAQAVNIAQDKIVNPNPENWTPNVLNGQINSIVQIGNQIYAGGQFTQVQAASGGTIYSRSNLFAFNATTGAIDTTFAPTSTTSSRPWRLLRTATCSSAATSTPSTGTPPSRSSSS